MGGYDKNISLFENALQGTGKAISAVPVVGDIAKIGQDLLVPGHENLTPNEQLVRAITTGVIGANAPGSIPSLFEAYHTDDTNLALLRETRLRSDEFQDEYERALMDAPSKVEPLKIFRTVADQYDELNKYNPSLDTKGNVVLPPRASQTQAQRVQRLQMNAPPGYESKITTGKKPGEFPTATYTPLKTDIGEFSAGGLVGMIQSQPDIASRIANGELLITQSREGDRPYFRMEQTPYGKEVAAGNISAQQQRGRTGVEVQPWGGQGQGGLPPGASGVPGTGLPPGTSGIQPGETPAEYRLRIQEESTARKATEKGLRESRVQSAGVGQVLKEMTGKLAKLPTYEETSSFFGAVGNELDAAIRRGGPRSWSGSKYVKDYEDWIQGEVVTRLAKAAGEVRPTDQDVQRFYRSLPQLTDTDEIRAEKIRRLPEIARATMEEWRQLHAERFGGPPPGTYDPEGTIKDIQTAFAETGQKGSGGTKEEKVRSLSNDQLKSMLDEAE
jgi:hypothetical protein